MTALRSFKEYIEEVWELKKDQATGKTVAQKKKFKGGKADPLRTANDELGKPQLHDVNSRKKPSWTPEPKQ